MYVPNFSFEFCIILERVAHYMFVDIFYPSDTPLKCFKCNCIHPGLFMKISEELFEISLEGKPINHQ